MQYDAALHFAGAGCISMVSSLVPCAPFAPLGTLLVMVGLVTACCLAYSPPPLKHGSLQLLQDFCALHRPSPLW
eukprot:scaffold47004_cov52-Phaeocystis_antarctica.AAC.1